MMRAGRRRARPQLSAATPVDRCATTWLSMTAPQCTAARQVASAIASWRAACPGTLVVAIDKAKGSVPRNDHVIPGWQGQENQGKQRIDQDRGGGDPLPVFRSSSLPDRKEAGAWTATALRVTTPKHRPGRSGSIVVSVAKPRPLLFRHSSVGQPAATCVATRQSADTCRSGGMHAAGLHVTNPRARYLIHVGASSHSRDNSTRVAVTLAGPAVSPCQTGERPRRTP
jgi:hypothetical protein